jgi:chromosome segregation ATPase
MSASSERMPSRQLGELMTELGLISEEQLATVLEVQQRSKRPLGQIIVELGFASGAAVAHALAMQSGGALKTEYGFALGVSTHHTENDSDESPVGLPKLRLATTAAQPAVSQTDDMTVEEAPTDSAERDEPSEEPVAVAALPAPSDPVEIEPVEEVEEVEDTPTVDEPTETETEEVPVEAVAEAEIEAEVEVPPHVETDSAELEELRAEVERLRAEMAEAQAAHEQNLARLHDEHRHAASELERLQGAATEQERLLAEVERLESALADAHSAAGGQEHLQAEVDRLEATLAETKATHEHELVRLHEEHQQATAQRDGLQTALAGAQTSAAEYERRLAEELEHHAVDRDELTAQSARLEEALGSALERIGAVGPAFEERDHLRTEVEQLGLTLAETQAAAAAEQERLRDDVARLENVLAENRTAHGQELDRLQKEHEHTGAELERLQTALAEAQTSAAEHERRLAEEQERHTTAESDLIAQRDRLQDELGSTFEQLAAVGPASEERDELRRQVERLEAGLAELRGSSARDQRAHAEERDRLTAELEEAHELLRQAEQVRESVIALTAERDRAVAEAEQLSRAAAEAQEATEEQNRLLAEEQQRHHTERQTLLAQRGRLEQELGSTLEELAAVNSAADERELQLQLAAERLRKALDEVHTAASTGIQRLELLRQLATDLMPGGGARAEEPGDAIEQDEPEPEESEPEAETDEIDQVEEAEEVAPEAQPGPEPESVDYSLFVPGPNGYELVPQTGVPPRAGETVELVLPDRDEPTLFEVVRSGRPLPDGDVCVYLAQV